MRTFHRLYENQGQNMAEHGEVEYRKTPGDQPKTPKSCQAEKAFRVIEKAIDAAVREAFGGRIKEEIAKEPAKLPQGVVNADGSPDL